MPNCLLMILTSLEFRIFVFLESLALSFTFFNLLRMRFFYVLLASSLFLSNDLDLLAQSQDINIQRLGAEHISTECVEYGPALSQHGDELYFARSKQAWGSRGMISFIYYSKKVNGEWTRPEIVSFSGVYDDSDPHLSRDGNRLYFISERPSDAEITSPDIWMVQKQASGQWGEATRLTEPLNSPGREYSPRTDGQGNLYFASDREGGYGQGDLYMALVHDGTFDPPLNMGPVLNSPTGEWNLEINKEGDMILFEASQRKQNITPYGDLYISFKRGPSWTIPQHLSELNTSGSDLTPHLTADQSWLYFASSDSLQGKHTDIYVTKCDSLLTHYQLQAKLPNQ